MELAPFPIFIIIFGSTDPASNQYQTTAGPFELHFVGGQWTFDFVCLQRIAHCGIGPFTDSSV